MKTTLRSHKSFLVLARRLTCGNGARVRAIPGLYVFLSKIEDSLAEGEELGSNILHPSPTESKVLSGTLEGG